MVPEFDNAIFTQKIGDIAIVKSNFGYHIVQVEERQTAHTQPLSEVQSAIQAALAARTQSWRSSNTRRRSPPRPSRTAWKRPRRRTIWKW